MTYIRHSHPAQGLAKPVKWNNELDLDDTAEVGGRTSVTIHGKVWQVRQVNMHQAKDRGKVAKAQTRKQKVEMPNSLTCVCADTNM